jgi:lipoprotein NlpD
LRKAREDAPTPFVHCRFRFPDSMPSFLPLLRASRVSIAAAALIAAGCATHKPVPVEERAVPRGAPVVRGGAPVQPRVAVEGEAPPAATYVVKRGDTLHQIALDNGLDYRELAAWNNIENVNRIHVGQVLRLTAPGQAPAVASAADNAPPVDANSANASGGVVTAPLRTPPPIGEATTPSARSSGSPSSAVPPTPSQNVAGASGTSNVKTSPKAVKEPYSEQAVRDMNLAASAVPAPSAAQPARAANEPKAAPEANASSPPASKAAPSAGNAAASGATTANSSTAAQNAQTATSGDGEQLDWAWPAKGKIVTSFSETANLKGIDIAGTPGEAVRASAPGRVVYAGNGLRGYGKLIIIKHNNTYLSAYAHNRDILVKEGQQVPRGQKIAEMGNTDADQVKLHFEIRRHGKPVDPTKFLPPT